jgi:hypothetical protein
MASDLSATGSSQSQTTTKDPQASVQSLNTGTPSSGVQPGTAETLLNSQVGVPLHGTALSTVDLAPSAAAAKVQTSTIVSPPPPKHHTNPVLFGAALLLLLAAIVLFWFTKRSVKSTT